MRQVIRINQKSRNHYETSKIAQSIIEELSCDMVISNEGEIHILSENLKSGFQFNRSKYVVEVIGKMLASDFSKYLVRVSIREETYGDRYLVYALISRHESSTYNAIYYELIIEPWEI